MPAAKRLTGASPTMALLLRSTPARNAIIYLFMLFCAATLLLPLLCPSLLSSLAAIHVTTPTSGRTVSSKRAASSCATSASFPASGLGSSLADASCGGQGSTAGTTADVASRDDDDGSMMAMNSAAATATAGEGVRLLQAADGSNEAAADGGFFRDFSGSIQPNPPQLHYGACASDLDGDGAIEIFVCGFGAPNRVFKWSHERKQLTDVATTYVASPDLPGSSFADISDPDRMAIGVAAADVDGDGREELYVVNTDSFGGRKRVTDRLFGFKGAVKKKGGWVDLFDEPANLKEANFCAGRSVGPLDRRGSGRYGFLVANYGCKMKFYEVSDEGLVADVADEAGLVQRPTGGRSLLAGPIVSESAMDMFACNENGPNFLFHNAGDASGHFSEEAAKFGIEDAYENCRGVAFVDDVSISNDSRMGIACGNWEGPHRLFLPFGDKSNTASDGATNFKIKDVAPTSMATPSRIRSVIAADFDNDGFQELFFNNLGQPNRLFRQSPRGVWSEVAIGDAELADGLGTGGTVADMDGDGRLELLISHGEAAGQPLALFRSTRGSSNSWIRVMPLTQQGSAARGASVLLTDSSGRRQKRIIDAGSGYLCCMEPVAHFGVGLLKGKVTIHISWPDGSEKEMVDVAVNKLHVVKHPTS